MPPTNNTHGSNEKAPQGEALLLSNLAYLIKHTPLKWTPRNVADITAAFNAILGDALELARAAKGTGVYRFTSERESGNGAGIAQGRRVP
ncbi:MAG: hypothetical protein KAV82_11730 [Phycisphaerae bacterium]|nr:hypothetical protein [Phycisphaerae bacterium]